MCFFFKNSSIFDQKERVCICFCFSGIHVDDVDKQRVVAEILGLFVGISSGPMEALVAS